MRDYFRISYVIKICLIAFSPGKRRISGLLSFLPAACKDGFSFHNMSPPGFPVREVMANVLSPLFFQDGYVGLPRICRLKRHQVDGRCISPWLLEGYRVAGVFPQTEGETLERQVVPFSHADVQPSLRETTVGASTTRVRVWGSRKDISESSENNRSQLVKKPGGATDVLRERYKGHQC